MGAIAYRNYTNGAAVFGRGYEPGDTLIAGWAGTIDAEQLDSEAAVRAIAERIFERHNADDRPDGRLCPSMSVGDVIAFGEIAVTVERCGFSRCQIDPADVIADRTWRDWIAAPIATTSNS